MTTALLALGTVAAFVQTTPGQSKGRSTLSAGEASATQEQAQPLEKSSAVSPRALWPITTEVASFITQSPEHSHQPYPCGSGVNARHVLHEGDHMNFEYQHSLDLVVRKRERKEGRGTDIVAVADGTIVAINQAQDECGSEFGAGNYVVVRHDDVLVDGKPVLSAYMHLNSTAEVEKNNHCGLNPAPSATNVAGLAIGSRVRAGQKLGELGNTGNSTGPHLHFQLATNCVLEPASEVNCPSIAVTDAFPQGFSQIVATRDPSCDSTELATLSDGAYIQGAPSAKENARLSIGGPQ